MFDYVQKGYEFNIHSQENQPCLCLCRFSLQIILTVRLRRIILQFRHIFLTDAPTFIFHSALLVLIEALNHYHPVNLPSLIMTHIGKTLYVLEFEP